MTKILTLGISLDDPEDECGVASSSARIASETRTTSSRSAASWMRREAKRVALHYARTKHAVVYRVKSAFRVKGLRGSAALLSRHQLHRIVPRSGSRRLRLGCTNESRSANLSPTVLSEARCRAKAENVAREENEEFLGRREMVPADVTTFDSSALAIISGVTISG